MSYREHDPTREAWLRDNVPRSQLPRREQYAELEGEGEWRSMRLPRQRRPPTAIRTGNQSVPPEQDWNAMFPRDRQEREDSFGTMLDRRWSQKSSPEFGGSSRPDSSSAETVIRHTASLRKGIPRIVEPEEDTELESIKSLDTIKGPEKIRRVVDTPIDCKESPVPPKVRHTTFLEMPIEHRGSKASTPSDKLLRPKTPHPSINKSKSTPAVPTFKLTDVSIRPEAVIEPKDSKDSKEPAPTKTHWTPSDKPLRPETPHPSIKKSKSTPAVPTSKLTDLSITAEPAIKSKGSKDSKGSTPTKSHRSKTLHAPKVSEIKAAFRTLRSGRNPPKSRASDLKSVFNTIRIGTLRAPKETVSKSTSTPDLTQTANLQPPQQNASESLSAHSALLRTSNPSIPSNPSTATKSTRPATPHPDSDQARTLPRRPTTVRLNGTVVARNLTASLRHDATMPVEDRTLRIPNTTAAPEDRTQQGHLVFPTLDDHHQRVVAPSPRHTITPFAEPYGCNTLNTMPAYFDEPEANNYQAITASHRVTDRKTIDVHGLPCGHRSVRLDPIEPGYAVVFDQDGRVCARISVGHGELVVYKHSPFVYIETEFGSRLRVDVSREGTFALDEAGELVKEEEGVNIWYQEYVDPRTGKQNPKGLVKRGWKACKGWMDTVKGTVKGTFKGTVKVKGGKKE